MSPSTPVSGVGYGGADPSSPSRRHYADEHPREPPEPLGQSGPQSGWTSGERMHDPDGLHPRPLQDLPRLERPQQVEDLPSFEHPKVLERTPRLTPSRGTPDPESPGGRDGGWISGGVSGGSGRGWMGGVTV